MICQPRIAKEAPHEQGHTQTHTTARPTTPSRAPPSPAHTSSKDAWCTRRWSCAAANPQLQPPLRERKLGAPHGWQACGFFQGRPGKMAVTWWRHHRGKGQPAPRRTPLHLPTCMLGLPLIPSVHSLSAVTACGTCNQQYRAPPPTSHLLTSKRPSTTKAQPEGGSAAV